MGARNCTYLFPFLCCEVDQISSPCSVPGCIDTPPIHLWKIRLVLCTPQPNFQISNTKYFLLIKNCVNVTVTKLKQSCIFVHKALKEGDEWTNYVKVFCKVLEFSPFHSIAELSEKLKLLCHFFLLVMRVNPFIPDTLM